MSAMRGGAARKAYIVALCLVGAIIPLSKNIFWPVWRRDFINFWMAGHSLWSDIDPYNVAAFQALGLSLFPMAAGEFNFTYPPHALFLFAPLGMLPPLPAFILWNLASLAFFYWAARPLLPKGFPPILAILTPAALINFNFGQTGLISAALFLLAFRGSGSAAALLTFKPQLGFLVIPALLRNRRSFLIAVAGTIALIASSALLLGDWNAFVEHARDFQGQKLVSQSEAVWVIMGTTPMIGYGVWGWMLFAAGAAYFLARNFNVFTAATATFLISPYGLHYDMAAVCLGFAVLIYRYWDEMPAWQKALASLAFLTPAIVDFGTWLVPPILLWGLLVQAEWLPGTRVRIDFRSRHLVSFCDVGAVQDMEPFGARVHLLNRNKRTDRAEGETAKKG